MKLSGYEFAPKQHRELDMAGFRTTGGWAGGNPATPPAPATPVYRDDSGGAFIGIPTEEGVYAFPYIPGTPADLSGGPLGDHGGFVPMDKLPAAFPKSPTGLPIGMTPGFNPNAPVPNVGEPGLDDMLQGMMSRMGPQLATDWLGNAAAKAIVAGGSGGVLDGVLDALGAKNPLASGPVAGLLGAALKKAGVGELGSLLPSAGTALLGGSTAGLAKAMGKQGVQSLLAATGLEDVPGAGMLASTLGTEVGEQLQDLFTGNLDNLTGGISDALDDLSVDGIVADAQNALQGIDPNAIGSQGLDMAADKLMSEWQVDDESSAAEHIAHKAVSENIGELKGLAKDELLGGKGGGVAGLKAKIAKFFNGEAPGSGMPVVRITDLDDGADVSLMGVGNILVEKMPVSRITDMVAGPKAPPPGKPIVEGAATVLSAELPTAFVSAKTAVPSVMIKGAPTVFVGGAIAAISPPKSAENPDSQSNEGPSAPAGPDSASSEGANAKQSGQGEKSEADSGDQTLGNHNQNGQNNPKGPETQKYPGEAGDALGGGKAAGQEAAKQQRASVDEKLKQEKTDAQNRASELEAKAQEARGSATDADAKASELERAAQSKAHGSGNTSEHLESQKTSQEAGAARGQANELNKAANTLEGQSDAARQAANNLPGGAGDLPKNAPDFRLKGTLDALDKAGKFGGPMMDIVETGVGVYNMKVLADAGEMRDASREAGGTIGSLTGGFVGAGLGAAAVGAFVVGTGGLGLIAVGAGAALGGWGLGSIGEAAGQSAGDSYADHHGLENRSGSNKPTGIGKMKDDFFRGVDRVQNSVTNWW